MAKKINKGSEKFETNLLKSFPLIIILKVPVQVLHLIPFSDTTEEFY